MCAKDFRLQNLPHDLNDAIERQIAEGEEGIPSGEEENCAGPKNKPTAEEGQGINDGNQNAQQQRMGRTEYQHTDKGNDENKPHQNQLRFHIAPDGGLQLLLCGMDGKPKQRCNMDFVLPANQIPILCEEISGNQCHKEGNEEAGNTAKLARCAALRDEREQKARGIGLQTIKEGLQTLGQLPGEGVKFCPEMGKPRFHKADVLRQVFRNLLQLCHDACAAPKAEQPQKGKQQQNAEQGTDATGDMKFLQTVCQRVKQKA